MIGEIHYWRDLARILEAVQVLSQCQDNDVMKKTVDAFMKQKSRVI